MLENNSNAIIILCSHICKGDGVVPLESHEWSIIAKLLFQQKKQPSDIFLFSKDDFKSVLNLDEEYYARIMRLLDRSASLAFELEKLNNKGIFVTTRADSNYPNKIKKKIGHLSPPLFYYCGDIGIANDSCIGFVGSRSIDADCEDFTRRQVRNCLDNGFSIVSGGAKGIDSVASEVVLSFGGVAIEYLSDSLSRRIKNNETVKRIRDERLLILSASSPDAPFNVGMAMQRNKYIYAQSLATIVVKSDYNKGGTWTGAIENLKNKWSHTYCWNNSLYEGNIELIKRGAIPINEDLDPKQIQGEISTVKIKQISIFDI